MENETTIAGDPTNQLDSEQINVLAVKILMQHNGMLAMDLRKVLARAEVLLESCSFVYGAEVDPAFPRLS